MNIVIHASPLVSWHKRYSSALMKGFKLHGINAKVTDNKARLPGTDVAVLLGPNAWKLIESNPKPYLMVNRKFLGFNENDIHDNVAIGWDGLNGRATFCVEDYTEEKLFKYIKETDIQPWHMPDDIRKYFLLCEQSDTGRCIRWIDCALWYKHVKEQNKQPMIIRHKSNPEYGHMKVFLDSFKKDMRVAKCGIVLNSTVSIDINLAGVPVIAMDEGCPTWAIDNHKLNEIKYTEDRFEFFKYLAHCQFHISEIESGKFWAQLNPKRGQKLCEWKKN